MLEFAGMLANDWWVFASKKQMEFAAPSFMAWGAFYVSGNSELVVVSAKLY